MAYTAWILIGCTVLFALRVSGQLIVFRFAPRWLPAMEHWYSGLMPYRYLLPAQLVLLAALVLIAADVSRGDGLFAASWWQGWAAAAQIAAGVYFSAMVLRYVITMVRKPERRWFKRTIPIWFHMVLATALWSFGAFHSP